MNDAHELPHFLLVQVPAVSDVSGYFRDAAALASQHGGRVLVNVPADQVECLEAGSPPSSMLLTEFRSGDALINFWTDREHQAKFAQIADTESLVLGALGLPSEGLPDMLEIPTTASVTPPAGRGPRAYMIIQGTGTNETRMDHIGTCCQSGLI